MSSSFLFFDTLAVEVQYSVQCGRDSGSFSEIKVAFWCAVQYSTTKHTFIKFLITKCYGIF